MESGGNSVVTALTTAFTSIAGDVTSTITSILPIALGVVGLGIVITVGIKVFNRIIKKS